MEPLKIGKEDLIYHAFYLVKSRTNATAPSLSYDQINRYIDGIKAGLDEFNMNYQIFDGATPIGPNKGFKPEVYRQIQSLYLINDKQNKRYCLPSDVDESILYVRTSCIAPLFLRGYLEPIGYEEILNLKKSKESEQGNEK